VSQLHRQGAEEMTFFGSVGQKKIERMGRTLPTACAIFFVLIGIFFGVDGGTWCHFSLSECSFAIDNWINKN